MSVELRFVTEGKCTCGVPYEPDHPPPPHHHHLVCDWGEIKYSDPRPALGHVGHLVIVPGWWCGSLLGKPPHYDDRYGYTTVTTQDDRLFIHMDHDAGRWTWELFPAHLADGGPPNDLLIGRWPD